MTTGGRVVKGTRFLNLRDAGDPVECAVAYDAQGADELVFLDITASSDGRDTMADVVERTAEKCFMPVTVGGGIRSREDMRRMLLAGADKVSVNTAALRNPALISEGAEAFGRQCIVVAIDAKRRIGDDLVARGAGWDVIMAGERGARRGGLGGADGRTRRRRDPAHQHGPRRHQDRLRSGRADARGVRRGAARR